MEGTKKSCHLFYERERAKQNDTYSRKMRLRQVGANGDCVKESFPF